MNDPHATSLTIWVLVVHTSCNMLLIKALLQLVSESNSVETHPGRTDAEANSVASSVSGSSPSLYHDGPVKVLGVNLAVSETTLVGSDIFYRLPN